MRHEGIGEDVRGLVFIVRRYRAMSRETGMDKSSEYGEKYEILKAEKKNWEN
jgi:hypothetical protein